MALASGSWLTAAASPDVHESLEALKVVAPLFSGAYEISDVQSAAIIQALMVSLRRHYTSLPHHQSVCVLLGACLAMDNHMFLRPALAAMSLDAIPPLPPATARPAAPGLPPAAPSPLEAVASDVAGQPLLWQVVDTCLTLARRGLVPDKLTLPPPAAPSTPAQVYAFLPTLTATIRMLADQVPPLTLQQRIAAFSNVKAIAAFVTDAWAEEEAKARAKRLVQARAQLAAHWLSRPASTTSVADLANAAMAAAAADRAAGGGEGDASGDAAVGLRLASAGSGGTGSSGGGKRAGAGGKKRGGRPRSQAAGARLDGRRRGAGGRRLSSTDLLGSAGFIGDAGGLDLRAMDSLRPRIDDWTGGVWYRGHLVTAAADAVVVQQLWGPSADVDDGMAGLDGLEEPVPTAAARGVAASGAGAGGGVGEEVDDGDGGGGGAAGAGIYEDTGESFVDEADLPMRGSVLDGMLGGGGSAAASVGGETDSTLSASAARLRADLEDMALRLITEDANAGSTGALHSPGRVKRAVQRILHGAAGPGAATGDEGRFDFAGEGSVEGGGSGGMPVVPAYMLPTPTGPAWGGGGGGGVGVGVGSAGFGRAMRKAVGVYGNPNQGLPPPTPLRRPSPGRRGAAAPPSPASGRPNGAGARPVTGRAGPSPGGRPATAATASRLAGTSSRRPPASPLSPSASHAGFHWDGPSHAGGGAGGGADVAARPHSRGTVRAGGGGGVTGRSAVSPGRSVLGGGGGLRAWVPNGPPKGHPRV